MFRFKPILVFCLSLATFMARSQGGLEPEGSLSVDVGIPTAQRNVAFNSVLEGLFNGGVTYQYNIYKGLTLGAGAKYSFFSNNQFALNQTIGKGGLHIPALVFKVGYEKFTTDRFSYTIGTKVGYANMISINDSTRINLGKPYSINTFFVEPQLELLLTAEKNDPNAFSLILGYAIYFQAYNPDFLAREKFIGFPADASEGVTRFFSLGFGYRYYFGLN